MKELNSTNEETRPLTSDEEYLALIINNPNFIKTTIVKKEYLDSETSILFEILLKEYNDTNEFIVEKLMQHSNFNVSYYAKLMTSNIYFSSKEIKFRELEKYLLDRFKQRQYKELTSKFDGDCEKLYDNLTKVNEIDYNETEYITGQKMYEALTTKNTKLNLGYPLLDSSLKLMETDLMIIGAGTGVGKTAFAINLLNNVSKNYQCIYFNMEMSPTILYKRMIGSITGITLMELEDINSLPQDKKILIKSAMDEYTSRKIILVNKTLTIKEITKVVESTKTDKHIVVFVDHLGLIKSTGNSLYEKTTNTAKGLRALCINSNCTVIALCQLGREAQKKAERPALQDLRDSGEIEQSSRKAVLLYNKTENKQNRINEIEVIIAKNDDGDKIGKTFRFDRYTQSFTEMYNSN